MSIDDAEVLELFKARNNNVRTIAAKLGISSSEVMKILQKHSDKIARERRIVLGDSLPRKKPRRRLH